MGWSGGRFLKIKNNGGDREGREGHWVSSVRWSRRHWTKQVIGLDHLKLGML